MKTTFLEILLDFHASGIQGSNFKEIKSIFFYKFYLKCFEKEEERDYF